MATVGNNTTLSAGAVDILNAIRNSASTNYRDYIPEAKDASSVKDIGAIIMDYPVLQNEFLNALINRIGKVILTNKQYSNPWAMFKKGTLEYGETVEEIFVELAKPFEYDPAVAESEVFKREIPDVRAAFHILNYKKFYKTTLQRETLRQAFLSADGITNLVTKIIESLYTAANYDEFQVMKYMIARYILDGNMAIENLDYSNSTTIEEQGKLLTAEIKAKSNLLTFMSTNYNQAGVHTHTDKDNQYLILSANKDAYLDVNVLASAFNMDKVEFVGHRVLVDDFATLDMDRLDSLFRDVKWYKPFTAEDFEKLATVEAVLVDKDWFMIIDNMYTLRDQENEQGLYWNYFYHVWKTFSASPFANAIAFVNGGGDVTSVEGGVWTPTIPETDDTETDGE